MGFHRPCAHCGHLWANRVIYLGLPMWLCCNEDCCLVSGFWSWAARLQLNDGGWSFLAYSGSYWRALWAWLRGDP